MRQGKTSVRGKTCTYNLASEWYVVQYKNESMNPNNVLSVHTHIHIYTQGKMKRFDTYSVHEWKPTQHLYNIHTHSHVCTQIIINNEVSRHRNRNEHRTKRML